MIPVAEKYLVQSWICKFQPRVSIERAISHMEKGGVQGGRGSLGGSLICLDWVPQD